MSQPIAETLTLASTLILSLGNPLPVSISGNQVWISDPKIIEAQPLTPNRALLIGKQLGEAFVYGTPGVDTRRSVVTTPANRRALLRCPQSHQHLVAKSDGSLAVNDWNLRVEQTLAGCGFDRLSANRLDTLNMALKTVEPSLTKIHMSLTRAETMDGRLRWRVEAAKITSLKRALGNLAAFCDFDESQNALEKTIVFKLDLFEFSKSLGNDTQTQLGTETSLAESHPTQSSKLAHLVARAKQSGRMLAAPHLRTTPGKTTTFNSGGEIPIQDTERRGTKTTWKPYGLKVSLTPQAEASPLSPEVSTKIEIQYLQPDYGNAASGVPSMITRDLSNEYSLPMGQTTLLTSMIYVKQGRGRSSAWSLGAIPLLGALFAESSEANSESELWFMITPSWASPANLNEIPNTWSRYGQL